MPSSTASSAGLPVPEVICEVATRVAALIPANASCGISARACGPFIASSSASTPGASGA